MEALAKDLTTEQAGAEGQDESATDGKLFNQPDKQDDSKAEKKATDKKKPEVKMTKKQRKQMA